MIPVTYTARPIIRDVEASIKSISYADILQAPNAQELFNAYAEECSIAEIGEPHPQPDMYGLLEASGVLHSFGVFDGEDLIGFATVLTSVLPHYGSRVATLESIFVSPEHRNSDIARTLMLAVEQFADANDCSVVLYTAPEGSRFDRLLSHLPEYRHTNSVYCRRLN